MATIEVTLVVSIQTYHNTEDLDLSLYCNENLKSWYRVSIQRILGLIPPVGTNSKKKKKKKNCQYKEKKSPENRGRDKS
jgi:hypothetical protein